MAAPAKPIATTNEVIESAVIKAPLSFVWHFVKLLDFQKFWTAVNKADRIKGATADTDVVRWTFKDGSSVEVKQDEYSVGHYQSSFLWLGCGLSILTHSEPRQLHHVQRHQQRA